MLYILSDKGEAIVFHIHDSERKIKFDEKAKKIIDSNKLPCAALGCWYVGTDGK